MAKRVKVKSKVRAKKPVKRAAKKRAVKAARKAPRPIVTIAGQPTRWPREIKLTKIVKRKDMGDVAALAKSIDERGGLISPVCIDKHDHLIAGQRRLAAWALSEKFCREPIPVNVLDVDSILKGERDENEQRKDFTPEESVELYEALLPEVKAAAKERLKQHGKTAPGRTAQKDPDAGNAADHLAGYLGRSRFTLVKAKAVIDASRAKPKDEKLRDLVSYMNKTGKVNGPWRRLQTLNQVADIKEKKKTGKLSVPDGTFDRIVTDMPWPYEADDETPDERGRGVRKYATMSIAAMKALPIKERCADNCVLYFWSTNFHMEYSYQVMRAWGFTEFPTIITWVKDRFCKGQRLRGITEHCIVAIKGKPVWHLDAQTTLLNGPVRADSQKPDEFYRLIDEITPAQRSLELFARRELPEGWQGFGDQVGSIKDAPIGDPTLAKSSQELTKEPDPDAANAAERATLQAIADEAATSGLNVKPLKRAGLVSGGRKLRLTDQGRARLALLRGDPPVEPKQTSFVAPDVSNTITYAVYEAGDRIKASIVSVLQKKIERGDVVLAENSIGDVGACVVMNAGGTFDAVARGADIPEGSQGTIWIAREKNLVVIDAYTDDRGILHLATKLPYAKIATFLKAWRAVDKSKAEKPAKAVKPSADPEQVDLEDAIKAKAAPVTPAPPAAPEEQSSPTTGPEDVCEEQSSPATATEPADRAPPRVAPEETVLPIAAGDHLFTTEVDPDSGWDVATCTCGHSVTFPRTERLNMDAAQEAHLDAAGEAEEAAGSKMAEAAE